MKQNLLKNPFSQWEITTACNNNCEGCEVPKRPRGEAIPLNVAIRGVDNLAQAEIQILEFIGGEPYAYPHMLDLIEYIYGNRPEIQRFAILTNALNREALEKTKPFLSKNRGGIVLSINYTEKQCDQLLKQNIDAGMAKKSLASWEVLDDLLDYGWVRINCVINRLNIETLSQIGEQVIEKGALFSFCPFVYTRKNSTLKDKLTFRSKEVGLALIPEHMELMERVVEKLLELKRRYTKQVVPSKEYINFLPQTCKNPENPYPINCKGLGLPYLRVSSKFAPSRIDGIVAPKLRACTDIIGDSFSKIVTSDLKYPDIIKSLATVYQSDLLVKECQKTEGCPWSVTFALSQQK